MRIQHSVTTSDWLPLRALEKDAQLLMFLSSMFLSSIFLSSIFLSDFCNSFVRRGIALADPRSMFITPG